MATFDLRFAVNALIRLTGHVATDFTVTEDETTRTVVFTFASLEAEDALCNTLDDLSLLGASLRVTHVVDQTIVKWPTD